MANALHTATAGGGRGRRRRGRRATLSEINVTPLVDVMLVLLIIFMISAPLLTSGVSIELPKTEAGSLQDQSEPLTLTVRKDGKLYIGEEEVPFTALKARLAAMSNDNFERPIYVRADGLASYEVVAQVMAAISTGGFTKINLITDTGGPTSGPKPQAAVE